MNTLSIEKVFPWNTRMTEKVISVMKMFGLDAERLRSNIVCQKCEINVKPGDICFITGASGAGKSVMLREIYRLISPDKRLMLDDIELENRKSLIDCMQGDFFESLRLLSKAGLSDVFAVLNQPARLSEGQKYRYRLARALISDRNMIFADEFCSNLDRITAAVISHNIRKFAKQSGKTFILASSNDDLLIDLQPDIVVIRHLGGSGEVIYRDKREAIK